MSDAADARVEWPPFRLVTYSAPTNIPYGWDAELLAKGAPDGLVCAAEDALTLLEDPGSGPLVCFGSSGLDGRVCLDPRTRQVVHIVYGAFGSWRGGTPQPKVVGPAELVGSSLDHFIALVRAATERFPFDSDLAVEEHGGAVHEDEATREERRFSEWARAAEEVAETLDRIDPAAFADPGEFWHSFVADVGMGIYATKHFLRGAEE
jgi:SUKH-4 immunity protein of toxin-antitoxin system